MDKASGPTSHDVVAAVRRAVGTKRVGHTGTLDPFASGLLLVLTGRATRLAQFLVGQDKRYSGVMRLGVTTDTCDGTGDVLASNESWQTLRGSQIEQSMQGFLGQGTQRPPAFSAKKIGGARSYHLARTGQAPDLPEQPIRIDEFSLTALDGPNLEFEVTVSKGTYIRALARDLGETLGCGAYLSALRRTAIGQFDIAQALEVADITRQSVLPARDAVAHLDTVTVDATAREELIHGRPIPISQPAQSPVAVIAEDDLVAIAMVEDGQLKPRVVLAS